MNVFRLILFPFAVVFDIVTSIRNRLYDQGLKPAASFDLPVISIGNLTVGGTGKTPMTEHLIRILHSKYSVATLSRGYGRNTRGIRIANDQDSAKTIGDEPRQFYKKFKDQITVAVGEERALAIPYIIHDHPNVNVILLDDAFQHRKVKASFQILLTDYNNPFYKDYVLPAGRLRESRNNAGRADVIVVTKCPPEISEEKMMEVEAEIEKYSNKPIFFTTIHYGEPVPINPGTIAGERFVLISGISNHRPLEDYVKNNFTLVKHFVFNDHHNYTTEELATICEYTKVHQASVLTTEKDAAKLDAAQFSAFLSRIPFFYLPIEIEFLKSGEDFDEMVLNAANRAS
jgi:tetraacyldisaccharide 4'-kinase